MGNKRNAFINLGGDPIDVFIVFGMIIIRE